MVSGEQSILSMPVSPAAFNSRLSSPTAAAISSGVILRSWVNAVLQSPASSPPDSEIQLPARDRSRGATQLEAGAPIQPYRETGLRFHAEPAQRCAYRSSPPARGPPG